MKNSARLPTRNFTLYKNIPSTKVAFFSYVHSQ